MRPGIDPAARSCRGRAFLKLGAIRVRGYEVRGAMILPFVCAAEALSSAIEPGERERI